MRICRKRVLIIIAGVFILLLGGYWGFTLWLRPSCTDRTAIEGRYKVWHSALNEKRFSAAYWIMSPDYRARHSVEQFAETFRLWGEDMWALHPKCSVRGNAKRAYLYPLDSSWTAGFWYGAEYEWVKTQGEWYMTGELTLFTD